MADNAHNSLGYTVYVGISLVVGITLDVDPVDCWFPTGHGSC